MTLTVARSVEVMVGLQPLLNGSLHSCYLNAHETPTCCILDDHHTQLNDQCRDVHFSLVTSNLYYDFEICTTKTLSKAQRTSDVYLDVFWYTEYSFLY